ncbi:hypothetical protein AVEN_170418-1, partial [Araneus ventricosus]
AEAGDLVAITDHSPTPFEGGPHYHRQKASHNHYCTYVQERELAYLYAASYLRTLDSEGGSSDYVNSVS